MVNRVRYPFYPGTGAAAERGVGNIVNVPLPAMAGSAEFRQAMTGTVLPAIEAFDPDLVMIPNRSRSRCQRAGSPRPSPLLAKPLGRGQRSR